MKAQTRKVQITFTAEIDDTHGRVTQVTLKGMVRDSLIESPYPGTFLKVSSVQVTELDERRR